MLKKLLRLSCVLAIGAGFVTGCGSGGSSPTAVTTVDGTKPLNTLTAAETTQLCNDIDAYMGKGVSKANLCKMAAVMDAAFGGPTSDAAAQAACTSVYNQCMAAPASSSTQTCDPIPATCTATVAQFSACATDSLVALNQVLGAIPSCNAITLAELSSSSGTTTDTTTTPASCQAFETACPTYSVSGGSVGMHH